MGKKTKAEIKQELALEKEKQEAIEREKQLEREREEAGGIDQINEDGSVVHLSSEQAQETIREKASQIYEKNLEAARELAKNDPKIVANVIKNWVNGE